MIKNNIVKIILLSLLILQLLNLTCLAITVPEKDINLKIRNLTPGCTVYLLIPDNLLKYNMRRFVENNKDSDYLAESQKADQIEKYLNDSDCLGYIEFLEEFGYHVEFNEIELRHYCFCIEETTEVIGILEYNGTNYVQFKINLSEDNEFKLIMKDYLTDYDARDVKFLVNEYNTPTYIDLSDKEFVPRPENPSIVECNIDYEFYANEDYGEIQRAIDLAYIILIIIFIICVIIVFFALRKKHIAKKEEKAARRFWEKRLTKEEQKAEKRRLKHEKRLNKINKKKK